MDKLIKRFKGLSFGGKYWISYLLSLFFLNILNAVDLLPIMFYTLERFIFYFGFILFPLIYIIRDSRLQTNQKIGWAILVFIFSYLGLAFYLIKIKD